MARALLASLTLLAAVAASPPPAGAGLEKHETTDVTVLFGRAVNKVRSHSDFARAKMLEADGLPRGEAAVDSAAEIVRWRFVLDNPTQGSDAASVTIDYRRSKGFAKPVGHASPFLDDVKIPKAPAMTLTRAVKLLDKAGFDSGFENVTLRTPLAPGSATPLYIFGLADGSFVAVDTKTGKVKPIS